MLHKIQGTTKRPYSLIQVFPEYKIPKSGNIVHPDPQKAQNQSEKEP